MIGWILGQRCGTSSLAKALYEQGFPLSEPLDTRIFQNVQPEGHYENVFARDWNRKLMANFKVTAVQPGLLPFLKWDVLSGWLAREPADFIVKDPQLAFVWPVWLRTLREMPGHDAALCAVWCRRDFGQQVTSLQKYRISEEDAAYCVNMYEACAAASAKFIPTLEVWLDDPDRVAKAAQFFRSHGLTEDAGAVIQRQQKDARREVSPPVATATGDNDESAAPVAAAASAAA